MDYIIILKGFVIGFIVSLPIGPLGIMCLRRMLIQGPLYGFFSGLGVGFADIAFTLIAALSLRFVATTLHQYKAIMGIIGGFFLILVGILVLYTSPKKKIAQKKSHGLFESFISMMFLTLSNPSTIFMFMALFAASGLEEMVKNYNTAMELAIGVFFGTMIWWLMFAVIIHYIKPEIKQKTLQKLNYIAGLCIISFGILTLISAYFKPISL